METIEEFKEKYSNLEVSKSNVCGAFIDLIKDYDSLKVKMIKRQLEETDEYIDKLIDAITNAEIPAEEYKTKLKEFEASKNYDAEIAKLNSARRAIELSWGITDSVVNGGISDERNRVQK